MRKAVLLLPLALIGLVLYMIWGVGEAPSDPSPALVESNLPAPVLEAEVGVSGDKGSGEGERHEQVSPEAGSAEVGDPYRIRVGRLGTGEPVPGARVSYYEQNTSLLTRVSRGYEDPEAEALQNGHTVLADSEGIAFVPVERSARITGRHEGLYGELSLDAVVNRNPEAEYDLVLEPDLGLTVRVVDFRGNPAPGVTVGIAPLYEGQAPQLSAIGTSSEDGQIVEPHLQFRLRKVSPLPSRYVLQPLIPGFTDGGVTIDPGDLPEDPVELRLPQSGRVLVRLADASGNLLPRFPLNLVRLVIPPNEIPDGAGSAPSRGWLAGLYEGGTAIFEHVVAGRSYQARAALGQGWAEGLLAGPRHHNDEVLFDLRMERGYYGLAGRILDEKGNPHADATVTARFESEAMDGSASFETDPDGSFWVFLRPAERNTVLSHLSFEIRRTDASPLRSAPILGGVLVLGTKDVGDVILGEPDRRLAGSGRLLVDGEPAASWPVGSLRVLEWDPIKERWLWRRSLEVSQGPEGSFEIHTADLMDRYRLEYRPPASEPFLPPRPVDFDAGARDLELRLETAGFLMADVLTEGTPPLDNLWLRLVPLDGQLPELDPNAGPGNTRSPSRNILYAQPGDAAGGRQLFHWHKLWPGRYLLEVQARGNRSLLVTVPDVRIAKGPNQDPRLRGIDLRGSLRQIRVTVTDPAGEPVFGVVFLQDPGTGLLQAYLTRPDRPAEILLSDRYADLLVAANGYRPKVREAVSTDTQVSLQPNPEVLVTIAGGLPELGAARVLEVSVESELPPDGRRYITDRGDGGGIDYHLRPRLTTARFEDGDQVALQTAGAGGYRVSLSVTNTTLRRSHPIPGFEPGRVELTGEDRQVLELRIPAEGLAEALQRVK